MLLNEDYRDILRLFIDEGVEFLVVGAHAMAAHGYPRATGDLDLWVNPSRENSERVQRAILRFGAPVSHLEASDFAKPGVVFQIGVVPRRIDVITEIDGVDFSAAAATPKRVTIEGMDVPVLSLADLLKNKESTGREKDALDAKNLRKRFGL